MREYSFDYNVPSENDQLNRTDLNIPVIASLLPTIVSIAPIVAIEFDKVHSTSMLRVKNLQALVNDCEKIALEHFSSIENEPIKITA